jgi:hypothetical protein
MAISKYAKFKILEELYIQTLWQIDQQDENNNPLPQKFSFRHLKYFRNFVFNLPPKIPFNIQEPYTDLLKPDYRWEH